ncbi:Histone H2A.2, partial [Rhizina undulata]
RSSRAGLSFPVGRVKRFLKNGKYAKRIGDDAPTYLAAVLEYLTTEILDLAGTAAHDNKKAIIAPRHLQLAIRNDEDFSKLLSNITIPHSGFVHHIHLDLLPNTKFLKTKGTSKQL